MSFASAIENQEEATTIPKMLPEDIAGKEFIDSLIKLLVRSSSSLSKATFSKLPNTHLKWGMNEFYRADVEPVANLDVDNDEEDETENFDTFKDTLIGILSRVLDIYSKRFSPIGLNVFHKYGTVKKTVDDYFAILKRKETAIISTCGFIMENKTGYMSSPEFLKDLFSSRYFEDPSMYTLKASAAHCFVTENDKSWRVEYNTGKKAGTQLIAMSEYCWMIKWLWLISHMLMVKIELHSRKMAHSFLIFTDRSAFCHDIFDFLWQCEDKKTIEEYSFHHIWCRLHVLATGNRFRQFIINVQSPHKMEVLDRRDGREFEFDFYRIPTNVYRYRRSFYNIRDRLMNGDSIIPLYYDGFPIESIKIPDDIITFFIHPTEKPFNYDYKSGFGDFKAEFFLREPFAFGFLERLRKRRYHFLNKVNFKLKQLSLMHPNAIQYPSTHVYEFSKKFPEIIFYVVEGYICQGKTLALQKFKHNYLRDIPGPGCFPGNKQSHQAVFVVEMDAIWRRNNNRMLVSDQPLLFYTFLYDLHEAFLSVPTTDVPIEVYCDRGIFGHCAFQDNSSLFEIFIEFCLCFTNNISYNEILFRNLPIAKGLMAPHRDFERGVLKIEKEEDITEELLRKLDSAYFEKFFNLKEEIMSRYSRVILQ